MSGETKMTPERIGIIPGVACAIVFGYASFTLLFMAGMGFFKCYAFAASIGSAALFIPVLLFLLRQRVLSAFSA